MWTDAGPDAITCYINCQQWDKAKDTASQITSPDKRNQYLDLISKSKQRLIAQLDIPELSVLAQKRNWNECLSQATKKGEDVLNYYLVMYVEQLIGEAKFKEAAEIFVRYKCPTHQNNFGLYQTLGLEMLAGDELNELELIALKQMMTMICANLKFQGSSNSTVCKEFNKFAIISHLELMRSECKSLGLHNCYRKICVSLLRYTKEIRVDKAFLDAGLACRDAKEHNMAFIILNRYLDLADAIDDTDNAMALQQSQDFENTDIPSPFETPLPNTNYLPIDQRTELKDWISKIHTQKRGISQLTTRKCTQCDAQIYEATLSCPMCKKTWEPCIASGYPLCTQNITTCKNCNKGALNDCWMEYVNATHHCPWCKSSQ